MSHEVLKELSELGEALTTLSKTAADTAWQLPGPRPYPTERKIDGRTPPPGHIAFSSLDLAQMARDARQELL